MTLNDQINQIVTDIETSHAGFYSRAIAYHTDERLKGLMAKYQEDGILLAERKNPYTSIDRANFPTRHVVHTYALYFAGEGFVIGQRWDGDFFAHENRSPYFVKNEVLIWENEERGPWRLLDAFPNVTLSSLEQKLQQTLKSIAAKVKE